MSSCRRLHVLIVVLCAVLASCAAEAPTELIVVVDSDLAVPAALDEITIVAEGPSRIPKTARALLTDGVSLPVTLGLRPGGTSDQDITIRAFGLREGVRIVSAEVRTRFVEGRRLVVNITLYATCFGVACEDATTCTADGLCVASFVEPGNLPPYTGVLPRADMGRLDAGANDLGGSELGVADLGPRDLGGFDLGTSDLGPPDSGPPDLGPPDLGPDLGPPASCSSTYGMSPSYGALCDERPTECELLVRSTTCAGACAFAGATCIRANNDFPAGSCSPGSEISCREYGLSHICVCSR